MLNLFKKNFKNINEYPDLWTVIENEFDRKPIFITYRIGLKDAVGHPDFPFQIWVSIPLLKPNEFGLPEKEEIEELDKLGVLIKEKLNSINKVIHSNIITYDGKRELIFYTDKWLPEMFQKEIKSIETQHDFQFTMEKDPNWLIFRKFSH